MERNNRILIVDDQQDLREQLAKLLSRAGEKNEAVSFVQQMRNRLLGMKKSEDSDPVADEKTYQVDTAGQGEDAYNMVKKALDEDRPYAVLFTDMRMPPGWDGLETAKKIREADPRIEIIIMTAYADHDQQTISQTVKSPEKLIYIKKPFHPEEIFQLALCLTSKWNAEDLERRRRDWLEKLIRCMSKIKLMSGAKREDTVYSAALKAILSFMDSGKGFITIWNSFTRNWDIMKAEGIEEQAACQFAETNSKLLSESRTTQNFDGKYLLPLKREGLSAVVVVYNMETQNDPEWYKLLGILLMNASDILCGHELSSQRHRNEKLAALAAAARRISADVSAASVSVREAVSAARAKAPAAGTELDKIAGLTAALEKQLAAFLIFQDIDSYDKEEAVDAAALLADTAAKFVRENSSPVKISLENPAESDSKIKTEPSLLKMLVNNMLSLLVKAAVRNKKDAVTVKLLFSDEPMRYSVAVESDAHNPKTHGELRHIFDFGAAGGMESMSSMEMTAASFICERLHGAFYAESSSSDGIRLVAKLPKPQQRD
jgi:CheY-like chemotaxis protein